MSLPGTRCSRLRLLAFGVEFGSRLVDSSGCLLKICYEQIAIASFYLSDIIDIIGTRCIILCLPPRQKLEKRISRTSSSGHTHSRSITGFVPRFLGLYQLDVPPSGRYGRSIPLMLSSEPMQGLRQGFKFRAILRQLRTPKAENVNLKLRR